VPVSIVLKQQREPSSRYRGPILDLAIEDLIVPGMIPVWIKVSGHVHFDGCRRGLTIRASFEDDVFIRVPFLASIQILTHSFSDIRKQVLLKKFWVIDVYMGLGIVRLVPPEGVDKESADTMGEGIEFDQGYGHVLTQTCNALRAESQRLGACDDFCQNTGFTGALQRCALDWYQSSGLVHCQVRDIPVTHRQIPFAIVLQDDRTADSIESYVDGPRESVVVQLVVQATNASLLLFALSCKHLFAVAKEHSQRIRDTEQSEDCFSGVGADAAP
jgi:hypothetical protein